MKFILSPSIYVIGMASFVTIMSCKDRVKMVFVEPPFEKLAPGFERFSYDVSKGDTLRISSGTTIIIPAFALTDSTDRLAEGNATILYREFRDEIDILLSGIPMDLQVGGQSRQMQTAGMFELRAMQGVIELGLAKGKKISVRFATDEEGTDYNFFALNDSTGEWEFRDYSKTEPNLRRIHIANRIEELQPPFKIPFDENYFVLNYNSFIDVYFGDNYNLIRKNAHKPAYQNKAKEFGLRTYDLYADHVIYQGNRYPAALVVWESVSGHKFPEWTQSRHCEVKKIKGATYKLKVSDKKLGKTFALNARLVMPLKYVFRFSPKQWKEDYDATMVKVAVEEKRLAAEARVFRSMQVAGFGIYNFDRLMKQDYAIRITAKFEMNEKIGNEVYKIKYVYGIPGDGKSVIKVNTDYLDDFYLDPTDSNFRFLTVLPDDKIALFPAWRYSNIDFESLASQVNPSYTFVMSVQPQRITSQQDLNHILKIARNN